MSECIPEPVDTIRTIDAARWARGGYVYSVTVRLGDGRAVRWYEAEHAGRVTVAETRSAPFDVLRNAVGIPRNPSTS
jgi:hypothetical protein